MKMRKIFSLMVCLCIMLSMLPLPAVAQDDILEDYFIIEVEEDLEEAKTPAGALNEFSAAEELVIDFEVTGESSYEFEAIGENQAETVPYWDAQITEEGQEESTVETALVSKGKCSDSITWELDDGGILTISGFGSMLDYSDSVSVPWIENRDDITKVIIKEGITSIGENSFKDCDELISVAIPKSVISIGDHAFPECKVSELYIDDIVSWLSITFKGNTANPLWGDRWRTMYVNGTAISELVIPGKVSAIPQAAFSGCVGLSSVAMSENITSIGNYAFYGSGLSNLYIPESMQEIGKYAFYSCDNLSDVAIPKNVEFIAEGAFSCCSNLKEIYFYGNMPVIEESAFQNITAMVYYPQGNTTYSDAGQYGGTLTWIPINTENKCGDNLTWTINDEGVLTISGTGPMYDHEGISSMFYDISKTAIKSIVVDSGVTRIGDNSFAWCHNLTSITLPDSLSSLGDFSFYECSSLTSVAIPESVVSIGSFGFRGCSQLTDVNIPSNVSDIGAACFAECDNLKNIFVEESNANYASENGILYSKDMTALVCCPSGKQGSIEIPESVLYIEEFAFVGSKGVDEVSFLGNAPEIAYNAFGYVSATVRYDPASQGWDRVAGGSFGGTLNWVPPVTGGKCGDFASWKLEDNTLSISGSGDMWDYVEGTAPWFLMSESINNIEIFSGITSIGACAFYDCENLVKVFIPASTSRLGNGCFYMCTRLASITIPEGVAEIGAACFMGCSALEKITFPSSITHIEDFNVYACNNLSTVIFQGNAPVISNEAFSGVTSAVYYSTATSGWEKVVGNNYGGTLTWKTSLLATPAITSVTNAVNGVTVKWNAVAGAAQYRVFYKTSSGWKTVANTTATSATITGLTSGTNYTFTVRCLSDDGKSYTSGYDAVGKSITYIAAPVITSVANAANGVTVKWNAVPGAEQYRVFYKNGSGWKSAANTTATSATITGLTVGTNYTFTVRCLSSDGKSYTSAYDSTGKSITYTGQLVTPVITSVANAANGVTVKWNAVSGAAQYRVFIKSGTSWKTMANTTSTSATITGLTSGTTYTFTVRCLSADGKSYTSSFDSTGKSITYYAAPKLTSVSAFGSDGAVVQWNTVPGVSSYRVYYKTAGGSWINAGNTTSTGFYVNRLSAGTKYTFTVRCLGADGATLVSSYDSTGLSITR